MPPIYVLSYKILAFFHIKIGFVNLAFSLYVRNEDTFRILKSIYSNFHDLKLRLVKGATFQPFRTTFYNVRERLRLVCSLTVYIKNIQKQY